MKNYRQQIKLGVLKSARLVVNTIGIILIIWICRKFGTSLYEFGLSLTIEKISRWAQIITAYAALFAVVQYIGTFEEKSDAKTKSVLDFVKFFREILITAGNEISKKLKSKKIVLPLIPISNSSQTLEFTEKVFFKKVYPNQKLLFNLLIANELYLEKNTKENSTDRGAAYKFLKDLQLFAELKRFLTVKFPGKFCICNIYA